MTHGPVETHPAAAPPEALAADCDVRFTRRSGPGGQNRNKVETAVVLTHRPTRLSAEASERRTQGENLRVARFRLRLVLALEVRRPIGPDAAASDLWRARCRGGRLVVSPSHDDFPTLLAEALDWLWASTFDPRPAAAGLGCSASQLVKLLRDEPRALRLVNQNRQQAGLHALS